MPLDNRLSLIAQMVQPCNLAADIGTDHGFLICELVKDGRCKKGIAADINRQPLDKARGEIARLGLEDKIQAVCTNGLQGLEDSIDAIVIAGMGGELIASIIDSWPYSRSTEKRFYLQPMTKAEKLRKWLYDNGFAIHQERCCVAAGKAYTVLEAVYIGRKVDYRAVDLWLGQVDLSADPYAAAYGKRVLARLEKQAQGMAEGMQICQRQAGLEALCGEIKRRLNHDRQFYL